MWNDCVIIDSEKKDSIKVLISMNSDQNCLIVTKITKNGFLKYATQGCVSSNVFIDTDIVEYVNLLYLKNK